MTETVRSPAAGDVLRLDGFTYVLGEARKQLNDREEVVVLRAFHRPSAADVAEAAAHKANFNYKKGGLLLEHELVWTPAADYLESLRAQASTLARGRPAARAWADACVDALSDAFGKAPACWTLPDRHLLLPAIVMDPELKAERSVLPEDPAEALAIARGVLDHTFYATTEG